MPDLRSAANKYISHSYESSPWFTGPVGSTVLCSRLETCDPCDNHNVEDKKSDGLCKGFLGQSGSHMHDIDLYSIGQSLLICFNLTPNKLGM